MLETFLSTTMVPWQSAIPNPSGSPDRNELEMTTATKQSKKVVITSPKIATAWNNIVAVTSTNEVENIKAIENLVTAMKASKLTIRDIMSVIKDTKKESSVISVSHVEGLATWSTLRGKFAEFKALPLSKQLSTATAGYKLLGATSADSYTKFDSYLKGIKDARKVKADKAKASAKSEPSSKESKPKDTLKKVLEYVRALDMTTISEDDADTLSEIYAELDYKFAGIEA